MKTKKTKAPAPTLIAPPEPDKIVLQQLLASAESSAAAVLGAQEPLLHPPKPYKLAELAELTAPPPPSGDRS